MASQHRQCLTSSSSARTNVFKTIGEHPHLEVEVHLISVVGILSPQPHVPVAVILWMVYAAYSLFSLSAMAVILGMVYAPHVFGESRMGEDLTSSARAGCVRKVELQY